MSDKTFAVAGWSVLNGEKKLRVAKDLFRIKVLARNGHTDIELYALPAPMTKEQALQWLQAGRPQALHTEAAVAVSLDLCNPVEHIDHQMGVDQWAVDCTAPDYVPAAAPAVQEEVKVELLTWTPRPKLTFDEALAQVPKQVKGKFITRAAREAMAQELMAA